MGRKITPEPSRDDIMSKSELRELLRDTEENMPDYNGDKLTYVTAAELLKRLHVLSEKYREKLIKNLGLTESGVEELVAVKKDIYHYANQARDAKKSKAKNPAPGVRG